MIRFFFIIFVALLCNGRKDFFFQHQRLLYIISSALMHEMICIFKHPVNALNMKPLPLPTEKPPS